MKKGRLPWESLPCASPIRGRTRYYWPLRMARLMLCTASTIADTDSGGVNWEIPWPRLNTWPVPADGATKALSTFATSARIC